ncbi:SIR2 family protein [Aeromonas veronii]|uniref:SIR2 family protein n=1 Tax=Aeromonas veronii TaxID=654 RepID=UPI003BA1C3F0
MVTFRFNSDLIYDFATRKVAIFIGSGVSASAAPHDGKAIRTWGKFLDDIATQYLNADSSEAVKAFINKSDYLMACEIAKKELGSHEWSRIIRAEYSKAADISELQKELLMLDQKIIVTTNFDKLLEENRKIAFPKEIRYPTVLKKIDSVAFKAFRDNECYIIKMHGSIDDEDSLIFTKTDYIQKAYGSALYRSFFENLIINYTILFVGFSMEDPVISMIVDDCAFKYSALRPHYIFMPGPVSPYIKDSYRDLKRLFIQEYSPNNNHQELVLQLKELRLQVEEKRREIIAEQHISLKK